ncbi:hypothetical protein VCHA50P416_90177 [Vibrio chagasii]|nr:hypothetical protein VCHA43P272_340029 [Vibrio chagasii]CAH7394111.1 hypothetical protein VCHA42P256_90178 [Vibrio chagasii]CAH7483340.1 hypothetical protein VCHA50P416_90177 [Vibrio chagasii]
MRNEMSGISCKFMCHIQYPERDSLSRSCLAVGNDVVKQRVDTG